MRIGWKLLILLLCLSVLPIVILTLGARLSIKDVGGRVAAEVRERLIEDTSMQLAESSRFLSEVVHDRYDRARLILEILRVGVVRSLNNKSGDVSTLNDVVVYKASDPSSLNSDSDKNEDLSKGAIYIGKDFDSDLMQSQIQSLASLVHPLQELTSRVGNFVYTFNVGLSDGVMFYYPDRGGVPANFDFFTRPWYIEGRSANRVVEVGTYVDANSSEVVASFSQKIPSTNVTSTGVVGIELGLTELLGEVRLPRHLEEDATIALVRHHIDADGLQKLKMLAQQKKGTASWATPSNEIIEETNETGPWAGVFKHLAESSTSGVATVPVAGVLSFWSYASLDSFGTYLFIVVPESTVLKEGQEVAAMIESEMGEQLLIGGIVVVILLIALVIAAIVGSRTISRPILVLSRTVDEVAGGNFDARADVRCSGELGSLAAAFNEMVPRLRDQLRMKQSLELAHEVQARLLPEKAPSVPGLDLAGTSAYCDETGGDYYDFLTGKNIFGGGCVIIIGDVTGHGVSAALIVTSIRAALHLQFSLDRSMDRIFEDTNRYLAANETAGQFMTLYALNIDQAKNEIEWVSAGHDSPCVYDPVSDQMGALEGADIPIGIDESATFTTYKRALPGPGTVIVLATDGVWEAVASDGEVFGRERLEKYIKKNAHKTAEEIRVNIYEAVQEFIGEKSLKDDVTIVVVKIL